MIDNLRSTPLSMASGSFMMAVGVNERLNCERKARVEGGWSPFAMASRSTGRSFHIVAEMEVTGQRNVVMVMSQT